MEKRNRKSKFAPLLERLRKMGKDEFRLSLQNAGIIDEKGALTKDYSRPNTNPKGGNKSQET